MISGDLGPKVWDAAKGRWAEEPGLQTAFEVEADPGASGGDGDDGGEEAAVEEAEQDERASSSGEGSDAAAAIRSLGQRHFDVHTMGAVVASEVERCQLQLEESTRSKSGFFGVTYRGDPRASKKWEAEDYAQGGRKLGHYKTKFEAAVAVALFRRADSGEEGLRAVDAWKKKLPA